MRKIPRFDLVKTDPGYAGGDVDHVMEPNETGEWVEYEKLFDSLPKILAALEAAEQILKRSQQISTNDSGKFRGVTTSSALIEVRAAIAKLTDGATQ